MYLIHSIFFLNYVKLLRDNNFLCFVKETSESFMMYEIALNFMFFHMWNWVVRASLYYRYCAESRASMYLISVSEYSLLLFLEL